jgi:hypothetical protein
VKDLTSSPPASDDTVEFQLSNDDMLRLSRAADAASLSADRLPVVTPKPSAMRKTIGGWAGAVAVYAAFMVFAWWGLPAVPDQHKTAVNVAPAPSAILHPLAMPTTPAPATVQVRNPFDASEVFEFPAGTSPAESHQKVAALLWQRAIERRARWVRIKPKPNLRMAKN